MRSAYLLLPAVAAALACSSSTDLEPLNTPASIRFSQDSVATFPGGSVTLPIPTVYDSAHAITRTPVTWTALTPQIASLLGRSAKGVALGVAEFEATSGPVSATVRVGVTREPVVAIITDYFSFILYGIDSTQLSAYAIGPLHDTLDRDITLRSLNPDIASISTSGMIHAHASGTAQISAATDDYTKTFSITVDARRVARIVAIPDSLTLVVGQEADSLYFQAFDSHGALLEHRPMDLRSSNESVLSVYNYYYFGPMAVSVGTATLIATSDTAKVLVPVTVIARP